MKKISILLLVIFSLIACQRPTKDIANVKAPADAPQYTEQSKINSN